MFVWSLLILSATWDIKLVQTISNTPSKSKTTTPRPNDYYKDRSRAVCPPPVDPSILDLPDDHIGNLFVQHPKYIEHYCDQCNKCIREMRDHYLHHFNLFKPRPCWGYEPFKECLRHQRFREEPTCLTSADPGFDPFEARRRSNLFHAQGDFGYVRWQRRQLQTFCEPRQGHPEDGKLECSYNLQFCRGRNVMVDLRALANRTTPVRYAMDVLTEGEIGEFNHVRHYVLNRPQQEKIWTLGLS